MKNHYQKSIFAFLLIAFAFVLAGNSVFAQQASFTTDLYVGSRGNDVVTLQTWLINNGYNLPSISSGAASKGYFGTETKAAVMRYQATNGIPSTGFFGPMTRSRFNSGGGYSGGNSGNNGDTTNNCPTGYVCTPNGGGSGYNNGYNNSNLTVTYPNGGETLRKGTTVNITWSGSNGIWAGMPNNLSGTGDIWLTQQVPACAEDTAPIRCMIAVQAPYQIASGVNLNTGSYMWNVGSIISAYTYTTNYLNNGSQAPDGQYKIKICANTSYSNNISPNNCDSSNAYFSIYTSGTVTYGAPVISGIDAPTTLSVGQVGTWSVRASDPANSSLSYSVAWGDAPAYGTYASAVGASSFTQTATFTHSYVSAGTYTVNFTVRNASGQMTQSSVTVQVSGGTTSAGPLQITSPNGGEVWQRGTTQTIRWTSPYYFVAAYVDLKLVPYYQSYATPLIIVSHISANQNYYSWNVGNVYSDINMSYLSSVQSGQYTMQICNSGSSVGCNSSVSPFTIY